MNKYKFGEIITEALEKLDSDLKQLTFIKMVMPTTIIIIL